MPRRDDIKKVLIIGAGPLVTGQACEFDYSGTRACKAPRAPDYQSVRIIAVVIRRTFLLAVLLGSLLPARGAARPRPNIIFFLSDDHATQAIGCYGGKLMQTPNLDRLASAGIRFDHCFCTEAICAPSRAAILTGKYGHVNGAMGWKPYDRSHRTFPESLRAAGYQTALVGKYHLGSQPPGFDYYDILPDQGRYHDPEFISAQGRRVEPGHVSDVTATLALRWLDQRDPQRPFAICINDKAAHMPWQPAKRFESYFATATLPEPASLHDDLEGRAAVSAASWLRVENLLRWQQSDWGEPPAGLTTKQRRSWIYQQYLKHYLRCAAGLDENVGRVLDWLDRNHLTQDTIVIYSSDQGFFLGEHGWFDKRWMMEESLRMPLLVRYPRLIKPGSASAAMVLNIDIAPTLLDLAGVAVPADMQGRSLRPLLAGEPPKDWRRSIYYRYYAAEYGIAPHFGVRTERYKLIHYKGAVGTDNGTQMGDMKQPGQVDEWELFDLQSDPAERINLYHNPESQHIVTQLKDELNRLRQQLQDRQGD
jgi:arylsulfatase A-like enzyme